MTVLVIAPHPDDEVLGMGGTIRKLVQQNHKVYLCVVSEGASAQYKDKTMIEKRKRACIDAAKILGILKIYFLDLPDMKLDSVSQLDINRKLEEIIKILKPRTVYTTSNNDANKDHQIVFESTLIATRPYSSNVKQLLCYEVPGTTKTPFKANLYEDITRQFQIKIKAFTKYKSEIKKFPHPRSIEAVRNLAVYRGVESGTKKAEAFEIIRYLQ